MDFNLTHETACVNETVFDGSIEQSIELDYLLPDYCKSIFKILKCTVEPKLNAYRTAGDKLNLDAIALIRVLYVSEEDSSICSIEQKLPFSKMVELNEACDAPEIQTHMKTDYINCRVVNSKRIDLRGAVTIDIRVSRPDCRSVVSEADGMGIQLCKETVTVPETPRFACKQFSVAQSLDIPYGKPAFDSCLRTSCAASPTDYKIIANKVVAKGELLLHIVYTPQGEECMPPETMDFSIPISQIMDIAGLDEGYHCVLAFDVCSTQIARAEESNSIEAELIVNVYCTAYKNRQINIISDCYSTKFETESVKTQFQSDCYLCDIADQFVIKAMADVNTDELSRIIDAASELKTCSFSCTEGQITMHGTLDVWVMAIGNDNMPRIIEKNVTFDQPIKSGCAFETANARLTPIVTSTVYSLAGTENIEVRSEIKVFGCITSTRTHEMITDITVNEDAPKQVGKRAALTLYFADNGESVWEIAKRYNTCVDAVMRENTLDGDYIAEQGMLLIPITD